MCLRLCCGMQQIRFSCMALIYFIVCFRSARYYVLTVVHYTTPGEAEAVKTELSQLKEKVQQVIHCKA